MLMPCPTPIHLPHTHSPTHTSLLLPRPVEEGTFWRRASQHEPPALHTSTGGARGTGYGARGTTHVAISAWSTGDARRALHAGLAVTSWHAGRSHNSSCPAIASHSVAPHHPWHALENPHQQIQARTHTETTPKSIRNELACEGVARERSSGVWTATAQLQGYASIL